VEERPVNSVVINIDGTIQGVKSTLTEDLFTGTRRRASHVEPVNSVLRWLFHQIRSRVSDDSRLAAFTRTWPCHWQARIFDGPVLGPFVTREQAIHVEIAYLQHQMMENKL